MHLLFSKLVIQAILDNLFEQDATALYLYSLWLAPVHVSIKCAAMNNLLFCYIL